MQLLFTISVAILSLAEATCYDFDAGQCTTSMSDSTYCADAEDSTCKHPDDTDCGTNFDSMAAHICKGIHSGNPDDHAFYCEEGSVNSEYSTDTTEARNPGICYPLNPPCAAGEVETQSPHKHGLDVGGNYQQRVCTAPATPATPAPCTRASVNLGEYDASLLDGEPGWGLETVCGVQEFIDSDGCDLFRHRFKCTSARDTENFGKCVEYTHDGRNCKSEDTHPIPKCEDLDLISHEDPTQDDDGNYDNDINDDGIQVGTYAGQGMQGWHFCQRENKCYHPQAGQAQTGASDNSSLGKVRNTLPTPSACLGVDGVGTCDITDRCDDYAGVAGTETGDKTPGDKGNWRDHIFEAPDPQYFGDHGTPNTVDCEEDYAQDDSASCLIHSLPKTNSFQSITQCAHGNVAADKCNGVTFYFNVADRGHNFYFNFCRHGTDAQATGANDDTADTWIASDQEKSNQWVKR